MKHSFFNQGTSLQKSEHVFLWESRSRCECASSTSDLATWFSFCGFKWNPSDILQIVLSRDEADYVFALYRCERGKEPRMFWRRRWGLGNGGWNIGEGLVPVAPWNLEILSWHSNDHVIACASFHVVSCKSSGCLGSYFQVSTWVWVGSPTWWFWWLRRSIGAENACEVHVTFGGWEALMHAKQVQSLSSIWNAWNNQFRLSLDRF